MSTLQLLKLGTVLSRIAPLPQLIPLAEAAGRLVATVRPSQTDGLIGNLRRVAPEVAEDELTELGRQAFASYGRYWLESLRLPYLSSAQIDAGFVVEGYHHIADVRAAGHGPIMVLPHLGGWEWAAAWLGRVADIPVTAVVEQLADPEVFEWFAGLRRAYGVEIAPLGAPATLSQLFAAIDERHVVCLVADRDIAGGGVPVQFFGETTTLPSGPALLARRSGAPILPTAVYFDGPKRICHIGAPILPDPGLRLRESVATTTQDVAHALEALIQRAPGQWHVLQPNWPSEPSR